MAWRVKIFLLLVGLTGVCMFCLQQVLAPFTSNFPGSSLRNVHRINDREFARAKLPVDMVKHRSEIINADKEQINAPDTHTPKIKSDRSGNNKDNDYSNQHLVKSNISSNWGKVESSKTGDYVTVSANGSLIYEIVTDKADSLADENNLELLDGRWGATTLLSPSELELEHDQRINHLRQQCKKISTLRASLIGRARVTDFFYTPKHNFAYCKVPKSGSTFWMQLFMVLGRGEKYARLMTHWTRAQIHERTRRLHVNPLKILRDRTQTVVVSRNPFTRLYSAYIDKVYMPLFWAQLTSIPSVIKLEPIYINRTVRVYNVSEQNRTEKLPERLDRLLEGRPNPSIVKTSQQVLHKGHGRRLFSELGRNLSAYYSNRVKPRTITQLIKVIPVCANLVTFEDFLQFIISQAKAKKALEPHWAPITHLCRPCKFNTYKIVKQESFATDVEHSLKSFGIELSDHEGLKETLTERRAEASIPGIIGVLMDKAAAPEIQACISPKEIAERIWASFQIQGFISDEIDIPKDELPDDIKQLQFALVNLALDAVRKSSFTRLQQKTQRRRHLIEAYNSISADVIRDIQSIYMLDFDFFDYSTTPPHLEAKS